MNFFGFMREVFSDQGSGSFARVASLFHTGAAIAWGSHFVWHTHQIPDVATLTGLAAFATAPYTVGKVAAAWGKNAVGGQTVPGVPSQQ